MSDKKQQQPETSHKKPETGKGGASAIGGCTASGCKRPEQRFSFCAEHYDHFKFGLIKKNGQPVPDYEKKFGHYQSFLEAQKTRKVA